MLYIQTFKEYIFYIFFKCLQQLQATIRDMEKIKDQILYEDIAEFQKRVAPMQNETAAAIKEFADVQNILIKEVEQSIFQNKGFYCLCYI